MTLSVLHGQLAEHSYLDWVELPIVVTDDSPDPLIHLQAFSEGTPRGGVKIARSEGPIRFPRALLPPFASMLGAKSNDAKAYISLNIDLNNDVQVEIVAVDETGGGTVSGEGTQAHIVGTVQIDGVAASRDVIVIKDDKANGRQVVGEGTSAGDGSFDITYNDWAGAVIALALDQYGQAFEAEVPLNAGTIVHPTTPNGHVYEVTTAGTTGTEEPAWTTESSVQSGSVTFNPREFYRPVASGPLQGEVTQTEPEPEATYIEMRIQILDQADTNEYNELAEFEFLDDTGAVIDLAGGSDVVSDEHSSFPASNAFDGDTGTRWNSGQGVPTPWIGYQFASAVAISQIRLTPATLGRAPLEFRIEYSHDTPGTWTEGPTYTPTWPDSTPQTFDVDPA